MDVINPHRFSTAAPAVDFDGFGNASRLFNGVDSQVTVEDNADLPTGAQTWACWVKINSTGADQDLMAHWAADTNEASILFRITSNNKINFAIANDPSGSPFGNIQTVSTGTLNSGQWYHIAVTFDPSNTVKIYINGSLDITRTSGVLSAVYDSAAPLTFGNRTDRTFVLDGNLCDCRIYDAALDATKIANLYGGENITTNLIGHWLKDTPSLLDHSGTNDGTNSGSAFAYDNPSPAVEFGKASRVFDGVNDEVNLGDADDFSFDNVIDDSPFSISLWFKSNLPIGNIQTLVAKATGSSAVEYLMNLNVNGKITLTLHQNSSGFGTYIDAGSASSYTKDKWHHAVVTYDGSLLATGIKVYVDGVDDTGFYASGGTYSGQTNTTAVLLIGNRNTSSGQEMSGNIADVRIYDTNLTSTDIAALYNGTHVETNLVGHWLTNTDDVKDYAGVNDGTNNGSTYSFDNPLGDGEFGSASRSFDGNDHVDTNASFNTTFQSAFSFACWVRFADGTPASTNSIFGNQKNSPISRWLFLLGTDGKIQSNYHSNGNTSFAKINTAFSNGDTGWIHLACVVTPSGQTLYLNGSQATLDPTQTGDMSGVTMGDYDSTIKCFIGARSLNNSPDLYLNGNLADVRIYDTDLTATDIFNLSRGYDFRTNLVGQWLTNKDDVDDYAGTNHGTNNGSTYSQDAPL